ncbi:tetratricopeptide repeat protein [bacterium]|nr:tetratricopeptide repeat protein [bacterium]
MNLEPPNEQVEAWQQAIEFFQEGVRLKEEGDLAGAMQKYRQSLFFYPTAEAHTFLGWAYASLHLYNEAISECKRAISVDATFGNAYNDIGAYLLEQGQIRDAIPWFQQAILAPRYEQRAYPFYNLGRAYEKLGDWPAALRHYRQALDLRPDYEEATTAWQDLQARCN